MNAILEALHEAEGQLPKAAQLALYGMTDHFRNLAAAVPQDCSLAAWPPNEVKRGDGKT